jgi:DNA-binding transcriptional LysR family regulator
MELRHLRYFVAAAEELHFRRAAERLGIAQPALSQQIQQLEQEIEALLFHRLTRGVELTDAGRVFLEAARAILEHVEQAKAKAQRVARGDQGMIRIGFTGSASFNPIVPSVIQDYRGRFPGIAVSLVESGTSQLVDSLRAGRWMPPLSAPRLARSTVFSSFRSSMRKCSSRCRPGMIWRHQHGCLSKPWPESRLFCFLGPTVRRSTKISFWRAGAQASARKLSNRRPRSPRL